jgi:tRNA (adenine22-N1)-methyltransferase
VLTPRLAAIAALVPRGSRLVDVGSGHGRLPGWLARTGRVERPIATERYPALARELRRRGREQGFELRVGDGLDALESSDPAEVIVLSGLGARSIRRILDRGLERARAARRLLLQPQTEIALLRRWLVEQAFEIVDERLAVERRRSYVVIAAEPRDDVRRPTHPTLGYEELLAVGPCLVRKPRPAVREQWLATARRLERILARNGSGTARDRAADDLELARRVLAVL